MGKTAIGSSMLAAFIGCCVVLGFSESSAANPASRQSHLGLEIVVPAQPEWAPQSVLLPAEWYQDTGSGGFAENFFDEFPGADEGEPSEDESPASYAYVGMCVPWDCESSSGLASSR